MSFSDSNEGVGRIFIHKFQAGPLKHVFEFYSMYIQLIQPRKQCWITSFDIFLHMIEAVWERALECSEPQSKHTT